VNVGEIIMAVFTALSGIIGAVLFFARKRERIAEERRRLADDAEKKLQAAQTESDILDAFSYIDHADDNK